MPFHLCVSNVCECGIEQVVCYSKCTSSQASGLVLSLRQSES